MEKQILKAVEEAYRKGLKDGNSIKDITPYLTMSQVTAAELANKFCKSNVNSSVLITENTSDGFHTFKELYDVRMALNSALFNEWGKYSIPLNDVHKSWKHNNGELCFGGGWFIVCAKTKNGQISFHYPASDWENFKIPELEKAKYEFDGHTTKDVISRLLTLDFNDDSEWISTDKTLPEENVNVLAIESGQIKIMALCYIADDDNNMGWFWGQCYDGLDGDAYVDDEYEVTHWMPIPKTPEK